MSTNDVAAIEAQVSTLDRATALRVTRLVLECGSSLPMALLAVQEADREKRAREQERARRRGPMRILGFSGMR